MDATLNPGNSGGPVLNKSGRVIGIVSSGIMLSGVNFAVPVTKLRPLIEEPVITIVEPKSVPAHFDKPLPIRVAVASLLSDSSERFEVQGLIKRGNTLLQTVSLAMKDGIYVGSLEPQPKTREETVNIVLRFSQGEVKGSTPNISIPIRSRQVPLRDVKQIRWGDTTKIQLTTGTMHKSTYARKGELKITVGKNLLSVPLAGATELLVIPRSRQPAIQVEIVVNQKGVEVARITVGGTQQSGRKASVSQPSAKSIANDLPRGGPGHFPAPEWEDRHQTLRVPAPIENVVLGGGGRYLILHLRQARKLAIVDTSKAKIAGYISLAQGNVVYAAGRSDVLVAYNDTKTIQRWDIASRKRTLSRAFPFDGTLLTMAMGAGSSGPLLMVHSDDTEALSPLTYEFFDPAGLRKLDVKFKARPRQSSYRSALHLRSSMDGTVFGAWATSHSPSGVEALVLSGNELRTYYAHDSTAFVLPSCDGSKVFTSRGILTSRKLSIRARSRTRSSRLHLPSTMPDYYFSIPSIRRSSSEKTTGSVSLYLTGEKEPLLTIPNVPIPQVPTSRADDFTLDRMIWLIPQAKMLVVAREGATKLHLVKVDIDELLTESDIDYLLITSQPASHRPMSIRAARFDTKSK